MSFSLSASDIIVVGNLVHRIIVTIRNARPEYQELVRELESLKKALEHVDRLAAAASSRSHAIERIKYAALTCRYPLEDLMAKIQRYEQNLGLGKSDTKFKDMSGKLRWAIKGKSEVCKIRDYLNIHTASINMMLAVAGLEQLCIIQDKTHEAQVELTNQFEHSSSELKAIQGNTQAQALAMKEHISTVTKLFWMVSREVVAPLRSLSEAVTKICASTQTSYSIVSELRENCLPFDARFTWFQEPVRVEDVLGRVFMFSSECSLEALNAEIQARFKQGPGKAEVLAGDYEISNAKDSKQILSIADGDSILPGMSITMAIVIER